MGVAFDRAGELVAKLAAEGITATLDPRNLNLPCVLIVPPRRTFDLPCGFTAGWSLWALVPPPGNADAFRALDDLLDAIAAVLPVTAATALAYTTSPDAPPLPAYQVELQEGL
jgi:hypothetical protein